MSKMLKIVIFLIVIVIGYIAYTGISVDSEYDDISKVRDTMFENVIDPLTKKALTYASESDLDEIFDSAVTNYEDQK
ncbi:MAG: hypothetical protein H8D35_02835 [Nitrosopumilus sp.]|nr:hypothetical protein [Nitrosopumilus sp.]